MVWVLLDTSEDTFKRGLKKGMLPDQVCEQALPVCPPVLPNGERSCNKPVTQGHYQPALRIQTAQCNMRASKRKWVLKHWQKYIYKEGLFLPTEERLGEDKPNSLY